MAVNVVTVDRETPDLFPATVQEYLPEDHPARFVVESVDRLDLSQLVAAYAGTGSRPITRRCWWRAGESRVARESVRGSCGRTDSLLGDDLFRPRFAPLRATLRHDVRPKGAVGLRTARRRMARRRVGYALHPAFAAARPRPLRPCGGHARADAYRGPLGLAPLSLPRGNAFLSVHMTVCGEIVSTTCNSTRLSANSARVQRAGPSGGAEQARRTRCASPSPSRIRSRAAGALALLALQRRLQTCFDTALPDAEDRAGAAVEGLRGVRIAPTGPIRIEFEPHVGVFDLPGRRLAAESRVSLVNPSGRSRGRTDSLLGDYPVRPRFAPLRASLRHDVRPRGAVGLRTALRRDDGPPRSSNEPSACTMSDVFETSSTEVAEQTNGRVQQGAVVNRIGIDLAKNSVHVYGVDAQGRQVISKKVTRGKLSAFMVNLPACLVAMEACGSAHHWARYFATLAMKCA